MFYGLSVDYQIYLLNQVLLTGGGGALSYFIRFVLCQMKQSYKSIHFKSIENFIIPTLRELGNGRFDS